MTEFFEEVEEQLRSDRYRTILARSWPYVVGAAVAALAIALGVWGYQSYVSMQTARASDTYARGLDALGKGDMAGAEKAFADVAGSGPGAYKALALMQEAQIRLNQNKPAEAADLFDKAARTSSNPMVSDIASLKAAYLLMDSLPYDQIEARLKPLAQPKRPYRPLAEEALGIARIGAGRIDEAKNDFSQLLLSLDTPEGVRQRAQAIQILLNAGSASAVAAVAKAADALPPPPPASLRPQAGSPAGAQQ